MTIWVGNASGIPVELVDPYAGDADGNPKQIQKIWVGDSGGTPRLVYERITSEPIALTAAATAYNRVSCSWTDAGPGHIYRLYRNSSMIYEGTGLSMNDTGRSASTTYNYRVDAVLDGLVRVSATASAATPARPKTQTTVTLLRAEWATYNGSGNQRTDTNGLTYGFSGYYGTNHGNQKCSFRFAIPAAVRDCVSVDKVEVSAYNIHNYNGGARAVQLALHHYSDLTGTTDGSTKTFTTRNAERGGWLGGAEWVDITNYTCPDRYTVKEEFRIWGACGVTMNRGPSTSQTYYGYVRNDVRLRITYSTWAA